MEHVPKALRYLRSVGADASQYYSERGEVAGRWVGGGAEVLGLRRQVQDQALLTVLAGYDLGAERSAALLLLDALPATRESAPVEEVLVLRDELADMAWAVEKTIESRTGRPVDRHEDEVARRRRRATAEPTAVRRYVLQTPVPRNWIPLLPKLDRDDTGAVSGRWLARGAMRDPASGSGIPPRGRLLEPGVPVPVPTPSPKAVPGL